MSRPFNLHRDEAELIVDLLVLTDHHAARDLSARIRECFGMVSEDREMDARKTTKEGIRLAFSKVLQKN